MTAGRQTTTNSAPARGIAGNTASANPHFSVPAGPFGIVAGPNGCVVGRFAWLINPVDGDSAPAYAVNQSNGGPIAGFVMAELQATITTYLTDAGLTIIPGQAMDLQSGTDFWAVNGDSISAPYQGTVYANLADGTIRAQSGAASVTGSIAAATSAFTASIAGSTMSVSAVASGTIYTGTAITGTNVASGTVVGIQTLPLLAGEAVGGIGRYAVSIPEQSVASTAIAGTYGLLTVTAVGSGVIPLGGIASGSGVTANSTVTQFVTGSGGVGTYVVNLTQTAASTTIALTTTIATKWKFASSAIAGELVKITSQPLG
jgi:hypothetical protein